jgi:predicted ATP-grasp superfamily ATP-dependent carboligase
VSNNEAILILDGEQRSALAVTRSLGKAGLIVYVGTSETTSLAGKSKYCLRELRYTSPYLDQLQFINDIKSLITRLEIKNVLPITDISISTILLHQHLFDDSTSILCSERDKYEKASDKSYLVKLAMELDIPVPDSKFYNSSADLKVNEDSMQFPLVLKPSTSIIRTEKEIKQVSVKIVHTKEELEKIITQNDAFSLPFMIQEKIVGDGLGIFALFENGQPKAIFSHKRLREKPPWGGVSVLCESSTPDPDAKEFAIRLLSKLGWNGVAMVEFKRDNRTQLPLLMEINARFWGSLQLSIDAGINFPYLFFQQCQNIPVAVIESYTYSRLRWLLGDLDNLYITLKTRSSPTLNLPSRREAVANFVGEFFNHSKFDILRKEDLKPFIHELYKYVKDILS